MPRLACIVVPRFLVAALLRAEPELRGCPLVLCRPDVAGRAGAERRTVPGPRSILAGISREAERLGVRVGERCVVGPGTQVARGAQLGEDCRLIANVTIYHDCVLGSRVIVHAGAVIGADGFGLAMDAGAWRKIPQIGRVIIGDDVEIGANTTIDRGALDDTVIEDGVKLDNQIQIGHNCHIGAHTAIAGCVGIAGSRRGTCRGSHCAQRG